MVAADHAGPTIEFPSRNERAEELMASDTHCAGARHHVTVATTAVHAVNQRRSLQAALSHPQTAALSAAERAPRRR